MKRLVLGALFVVAVGASAEAQVPVSINIGFQLPAPPTLVVVPGTPVYYAPDAPANIFFYAHQYWAFVNGGWYVGSTWNGPWAVVEPLYVPAPVLHVPVRYYPVPAPHWPAWRREAPPPWESHYGREWREEAHERHWREHEERWDHHEGKGWRHHDDD